MARMPLPLPRSSTRSPGAHPPLEQRERRAGGAVLPAAERRLGIEDHHRRRPGRSAPRPRTAPRQPAEPAGRRDRRASGVVQSTGSSRRRLGLGRGARRLRPARRSARRPLASSGAKVTSVPSSRSSTAWPVRATSHAPSRSRRSGGGLHVDGPPAHAPSASLSLDQNPGERLGGSPSSLGQLLEEPLLLLGEPLGRPDVHPDEQVALAALAQHGQSLGP